MAEINLTRELDVDVKSGIVNLKFYIYDSKNKRKISPFSDELFNSFLRENFKYISYDDFKKIKEPYLKKIADIGVFETIEDKNGVHNRANGFTLCLDPEEDPDGKLIEKKIQEKTQQYVNLFKSFISELKELNDKRKIKNVKEKQIFKIKI